MREERKKKDFWDLIEKYFGDFLDHFTRIDDLLRETNRKLDRIIDLLQMISYGVPVIRPPEVKVKVKPEERIIPPPRPREVPPITVQFPIMKSYDILEFDLSVERKDFEVGLRKRGITVYGLTVLQCDSECSIKLNSTGMKPIPCSVGLQITDFEIKEIYVSNPPGSGYLKIYIEWR